MIFELTQCLTRNTIVQSNLKRSAITISEAWPLILIKFETLHKIKINIVILLLFCYRNCR